MGKLYERVKNYLVKPVTGTFVEIGSDRLEGSTLFFANLAQQYNTVLHSVDMLSEAQTRINHPCIKWHVEIGSSWCKNTWPNIASPIDVLYLDNYDYQYSNEKDTTHFIWNQQTYDNIKGPDWPSEIIPFDQLDPVIQKECGELLNLPVELLCQSINQIYHNQGFRYTNDECQLEHLSQIIALMPWIHDQTLIVFDDTFTNAHGCWAGKNGPGVVFLKTQGFSVVESENLGVILKKKQK